MHKGLPPKFKLTKVNLTVSRYFGVCVCMHTEGVSRVGRQLLVRLMDRLGRMAAEARTGAAEGLAACGK